jgi:hypothetical protein
LYSCHSYDINAIFLDTPFIITVQYSAIVGNVAVVIEQVVNASKNRFVIDIPEEDEDYFDRLLGYSSNVISWHIQHKKEQ